jgi:predicted PurR-regulated permease PerM
LATRNRKDGGVASLQNNRGRTQPNPPESPPAPAPPLPGPAPPPGAGPQPVSEPQRDGTGALKVVAVLLGLYTAYFAKAVLVPVVLAFLFSLLFSPLVRAMKRFLWVPHGLGALIVVLLVTGAIGGAFYSLGGPVQTWVDDMPEILQDVEAKLKQLPIAEVQETAKRIENAAQPEPAETQGQPVPVEVRGPTLLTTLLTGTLAFSAGVVMMAALLYFLLATGNGVVRRAMMMIPDLRRREASQLLGAVETEISHYLGTITLINAGLGLAVGGALHLLGMPNPLLWGVMAALFNYIPFLGAMAGITIIALVSLVTFEGWLLVAAPPLAYLALTVVEAQFVTPGLLARRLSLDPAVILLMLILWTWMWGIAGALLAVPMIVVIRIAAKYFESLRALGSLLGGGQSGPVNGR